MNGSGRGAEDLALAHLVAHGCTLVTRNYRCRLGEIDLVVSEGSSLVFVEVRQRSSNRFGGAAESITPRKRQRIVATARHFLSSHPVDRPCRFDAILVDGAGRVDWIRDAFGE